MKKPKTFMLVGVGLLVLGIFYVLGLAMNVVMIAIPAMREQNPALRLLDQDATYATIHYVSLALNGFLGLVAIVAGIGLIKCRNWGRMLGITWAAVTILSTPLGLWVTTKYVQPATAGEMQKEMSKSGAPAEMGETILKVTNVMTMVFMVFWVAFCIVMIIFLSRAKMKAWCHLQETQAPRIG